MINVGEVKQKILKIVEETGPILPTKLSKKVELSPMFTSAILSELVNERKLDLSNMKVGSSPLYLLPNQKSRLEDHMDNITGIEKTALLRLRDEKILKDRELETPIKVALRSIKDFAIPFKKGEEIFWRYAFAEEGKKLEEEAANSFEDDKKKVQETPSTNELIENKNGEEKKETINEEDSSEKKSSDLSNKMENIFEVERPKKTKKVSADEKFLETIRCFADDKGIKLKVVEEYTRKKVFARIEMGERDYLLVAFDKKRVTNTDLLEAYKKAATLGIPYYVVCKGDPTKKLQEEIRAHKSLLRIDHFE